MDKKPFPESYIECDICGYDCMNNSTMQKHLDSTHKTRKFQCVICDAKFTETSRIGEHVRDNHREKMVNMGNKPRAMYFTVGGGDDSKKRYTRKTRMVTTPMVVTTRPSVHRKRPTRTVTTETMGGRTSSSPIRKPTAADAEVSSSEEEADEELEGNGTLHDDTATGEVSATGATEPGETGGSDQDSEATEPYNPPTDTISDTEQPSTSGTQPDVLPTNSPRSRASISSEC